ncbi:hypothetical protein FCL47_02710 [Desulfopila sp. IMCC35006]|uniref:hypothetical protein n=1 Tax=Desulfopila sp. IMCC35006 TaxID=2569542 RepID=UPI0010ACC5AE|nr:hypothetical protein [Desulfopila sp. IMCC35006]TKB28415.1 hypothetical protein FCL47_02710 [Desulfopila sp. IMCC35006]
MKLSTENNIENKKENLDGDLQENFGQVDIDSSFVLVNALIMRPVAGPLMVIDSDKTGFLPIAM